jgi:twitching motility protein PilT
MPAIDRFLGVMQSQHASVLQLAADQPACLDVSGGASRAITRQPLTGAQVHALLREMAPAESAQALESGTTALFTYRADGVEYCVQAQRGATGWGAEVRPAPPPPSGHAPAPAAPAPPVIVDTVSGDEGASRARMDALLRELVECGGSDLHLRVGEPPIVRLHGQMSRLEGHDAMTGAALEAMLHAIAPDRNRNEFAEHHDTDFAYELPGLARFRCNALRARHGAAAVFRVIPARVVTADELGLSPEIQALCNLSRGLVLVTGPTGSGKSTTLAALIDLINRTRTDHVITIEDPIEFVHENKKCIITQRQVGTHTGSFKHALRAALREDPDIILVGELRDLETMSIAIETAETGHLVFGTLHTTSAVSTVDRLIDQFPADRQSQIRVMLSESLKGVISQVLCRKIGGGRVAALEVLLSMPSVSNLIREGKTYQLPSVLQTSKRLGMVMLNDALMVHVDAGTVEPKEAYLKASDKQGLLATLSQRGHDTSFVEGPDAAAARQVSAKAASRTTTVR